MHYLESRFFKFQWVIHVIIFTIFILLPEGQKEPFIDICAFVMLVFVGIPHGANDLLYRKNKTFQGGITFLLIYLSSMAIYALLWWLHPLSALIVFFFISIHHFGQSNFESPNTFHLPSLFWGVGLFLFPVLIHFDESIKIFSEMIRINISIGEWEFTFLVLRYFLLFVYIIIAILNYKNLTLYIILQVFLIAIWYEYTPLLSGFIIVFTLWHSCQSLFYQFKYYKEKSHSQYSLTYFVINMVIFTIMAGIFLHLISLYFTLSISVLFVLLSIITLPHVVVMDGIYKTSYEKL